MAYIEMDNLGVRFDASPLWEGLTDRIDAGQHIRIAGPSGCGKTTLLKCLMGFVPRMEGTIKINGQTLDPASVWTLRPTMAYLSQEPDLGTGNVLQRMREPFGYRCNEGLAFDNARLMEWLTYFGLPEALLNKDLKTLSGGEKQRLAIILTVLLDRKVFLLDEPVSALDTASRRRFVQLFRDHPDWTLVFISHDESLAELADRTLDLSAFRRTAL